MTFHDVPDEPTPQDRALLAELRRVLEIVDPVPPSVVELGKAAYALRSLDDELMLLVELAAEPAGAVRSAATSRMHFFELGPVSIDIDVRTSGDEVSVVGVVVDADGVDGARVTVSTPSSSVTAEIDDAGRFEVSNLSSGLLRITLDRASGGRAVTPWFEGA